MTRPRRESRPFRVYFLCALNLANDSKRRVCHQIIEKFWSNFISSIILADTIWTSAWVKGQKVETRFNWNDCCVNLDNLFNMITDDILTQETPINIFDKYVAPSLKAKLNGNSRLWLSKIFACNTPCLAINRIITATACSPTVLIRKKSSKINPSPSLRCASPSNMMRLSFSSLCIEFRSVYNTFAEMMQFKQPSRVNKIATHGFFMRIKLLLLCKN